jgi:hypothetical protein
MFVKLGSALAIFRRRSICLNQLCHSISQSYRRPDWLLQLEWDSGRITSEMKGMLLRLLILLKLTYSVFKEIHAEPTRRLQINNIVRCESLPTVFDSDEGRVEKLHIIVQRADGSV